MEAMGTQNMNMDPNMSAVPMMNEGMQQNPAQYPVVGGNLVALDKFDGVTMNTVLRWKQYNKMNVDCFLGFNEGATDIDKLRGAEILQTMGHFYCILCECYIRANKKSVGRHQNSNRRHVRMLQEYTGARAIMMPVGQPLKNSFDIANHHDYLPQHELDHHQHQHQHHIPYQHMSAQPADAMLHNHQYMNMQMMQSSSASSYTGVAMQAGQQHSSAPKMGAPKPTKRARTSGANAITDPSGLTLGHDLPTIPPGQEAWNLISHPAKVADMGRLTELLAQLRVCNGDDLLRCQPTEIVEIIQTLKVVPGRRLLQLFSALNANAIAHQPGASSSSSS